MLPHSVQNPCVLFVSVAYLEVCSSWFMILNVSYQQNQSYTLTMRWSLSLLEACSHVSTYLLLNEKINCFYVIQNKKQKYFSNEFGRFGKKWSSFVKFLKLVVPSHPTCPISRQAQSRVKFAPRKLCPPRSMDGLIMDVSVFYVILRLGVVQYNLQGFH